MRLGARAAEVLRLSERCAKGADICREQGESGAEPAELGASGGVAGADEQSGVFEAVGELVEEVAGFGFEAAFNGDQTVKHVAEETELDARGAAE